MRTERWIRVEALFQAAFEQPLDVRDAVLRMATGTDPDIVDEVRALLDAHAGAAESFLAALDLERAAAFLVDSDLTLRAGQHIGPYVVERELGRGGMAVIYLVRDPRLEREVALKLLSPALAGDPDAKRRLLAEARAASIIDHPNIATILDIGETDDGRLWIAMPRYRGSTLRERIAGGRLPVREALALARQIAAGLAAAHERGIVHRDIKPANVIVTADATARILDFGIARLAGETVTHTGVTIGTVAYMSPEQTVSTVTDARTDVWSLGVVLYEMLCGRRPFEGQNDSAVIHGIREDEPPPLQKLVPQLPDNIVSIVERCLMKEPTRRFASMRELSAALAATEAGLEREADATLPPRLRRSRIAVWSAAAVLIVTLLAWGFQSRIARSSPVHVSASSLAVLPLSPVVPDGALARLGVELAITLARALESVGELRVTDPVTLLAQLGPDAPLSFEEGARVARQLGATSLIHGTIVRAGTDVRIDATMRAVNGDPVAQATVTGAPDDFTALTDAVAVELLRQIWRRGRAPVPNLAAVTTHSISALRAYLEGERAIAESRFYDAPGAFERAIAFDSTFWFAWWRLWYARAWHGLPVDSAVRAAVTANLDALPGADRALATSRIITDELLRHDRLQTATRDFPNYWPAWFDYADWLVHHGPYHGFPLSAARSALEQVVSLNPDLVPAWEHLFWVAIRERDAQRADRILGEFERLRVDSLRAPELRYDVMQYYDFLAALVRSRGEPDVTRAEAGAALLAGLRSRTPAENLSASVHVYGFHRAQIDLLDRIIARRPAPDIVAMHRYGRALAWAARGAWDSALVSAERYARDAKPAQIELLPAQIAALGALIGALDTGPAATQLDDAVERARAFPASPAAQAEIAWLQGLTAFVRTDPDAIRQARTQLRLQPPNSGAHALERSLAALEAAAAGRTDIAGDSLAALEHDGARSARQFAFGQAHPFFSAVNRLLAARWLIENGQTAIADALLLFHDATFPAELRRVADANLILAPLALLERARIAGASGRVAEARRLYDEAFERLDSPVPAIASWILSAQRARDALEAAR